MATEKTAKNFRGYFILPHPVQHIKVETNGIKRYTLLVYVAALPCKNLKTNYLHIY